METEEVMVEQFAEIDKSDQPVTELPTVEVPKVGTKVYVCDICGKEVSSALALSGHMRSHK
jgi:hypothetical protein